MLNWADYTIIGIIGLSTVISLARGFVREGLSLVIWISAFWVSFHFYHEVSQLLTNFIHSPTLRIVTSFVALFVLTLLLGAMISYLITQAIDVTGLSGMDRMLGVIFGGGRGVLVVAVLIMLARLTPMPDEIWWKKSLLIPYFFPLEAWLHQLLPPSVLEHLRLPDIQLPGMSSAHLPN